MLFKVLHTLNNMSYFWTSMTIFKGLRLSHFFGSH